MQGLQKMRVWSLSKEDPLEESMAVHSSMLAQRITWIKNPGRLQSIVSQRVRYSWNDLACKTVLIVTNFPSFSLPRNIFTKPSFLKHIFSKYTVYFLLAGICCLFSRIQADTDLSGPFLDETSCRPYLISR